VGETGGVKSHGSSFQRPSPAADLQSRLYEVVIQGLSCQGRTLVGWAVGSPVLCAFLARSCSCRSPIKVVSDPKSLRSRTLCSQSSLRSLPIDPRCWAHTALPFSPFRETEAPAQAPAGWGWLGADAEAADAEAQAEAEAVAGHRPSSHGMYLAVSLPAVWPSTVPPMVVPWRLCTREASSRCSARAGPHESVGVIMARSLCRTGKENKNPTLDSLHRIQTYC
jgi:hypothetical protein